MGDLEVGDYVCTQYGKNIWGNNDVVDYKPVITKNHKNIFRCKTIDKELAYFLGIFLAEGSCYRVRNKDGDLIGGSVTLCCGDDLKPMLKKIGLNYYHDGGLKYTISSKT